MKKEMISFVIGAGVVGSVWLGTTFCKSKPAVVSAPVATAQKNAAAQPNLLKKILRDGYSSASKSEAGPLSLYPDRWLSLQNELGK